MIFLLFLLFQPKSQEFSFRRQGRMRIDGPSWRLLTLPANDRAASFWEPVSLSQSAASPMAVAESSCVELERNIPGGDGCSAA